MLSSDYRPAVSVHEGVAKELGITADQQKKFADFDEQRKRCAAAPSVIDANGPLPRSREEIMTSETSSRRKWKGARPGTKERG